MKRLSVYFLRGLFTLLPFGLTVYVFFVFLRWSEALTSRSLTWLLGDGYIPGMGLVLAFVVIILLGFFVSRPIFNQFIDYVELPFKNVPILKSVYSALKSLSDYFSPDGENAAHQVVVVKMPNTEIEVVGFLTRKNLSDLPDSFTKGDRVAVYFPMSYQIGGFTAFVPRAWIKESAMPVEVAMRSALTAWMSKD